MVQPRRRPTAARRTPAAPTPTQAGRLRAPPRALAWILGGLVLLALAWGSRGGPLGTPAADDYDYLYSLRFEHPLDFWGPMGSRWYWRPLSRQLYYLVFDRAFFAAPWLVAAFHAALLAALFALAWRATRRLASPWTAAGVAAFPLLALPARALLGWPTGAQPLLAMVLVALAVHETLARRPATALGALAAALLAHAQAALAVPVLPVVAWRAWGDRRRAGRFTVGVALVGALYAAGTAVAQAHGAGWPSRVGLAAAAAAMPGLIARSVALQMNLHDLAPGWRLPFALTELALALVTALALARRSARSRLRAVAPAVLLGAGWFLVGVGLLAFAPDLFTPRHTCLPSLGLSVAVGALAACASPALAALWITVRLCALVVTPGAPATLDVAPPLGSAPMAFQEIVRLQRVVGSARTELLRAYPSLPPGATVRYWSLPRASEVAFDGPRAVRVWYGDSTLAWSFWDRAQARPETNPPPTLAFNLDARRPAVVMRPAAIRAYEEGMAALDRGDLTAAEPAFAAAEAAQEPRIANFSAEITRLRARLALELGEPSRADSLNEVDRALSGPGASYEELRAVLAWRSGRLGEAEAAALRCLELMPGNLHAQAILDTLRLAAARAMESTKRTEPAPGTPPGR